MPGLSGAWSSNTPTVATVDNSGLITGVSRGSAQVTVTFPGTSAVGRFPVTVLGVISVGLNVGSALLEVGRTQQLSASVTADPGITPQAVVWTSSNPAVVTVNASGLLTAVGIGQATITATCEGRSTSVSAVVIRASVSTVSLEPASIAIQVGQTNSIVATVRDGAGAILTDRTATWSSSNPTVASIGATGALSGTLTAVSPGNATITATVEGVQRTALVTVTPLPDAVSSISVTPTSADLFVGQAFTLNYTLVRPSGAPTATVTYGTTNPGVAVVSSSGVVTAIAPGNATITVTASAPGNGSFSAASKTATATVAVTVVPVANVVISPGNMTLTPGATQPLTATARDASGNALSGRSVTWRTANTAVATVSTSGVLTAVAPGTTTVTATVDGVQGSGTITVLGLVPAITSLTVSPTSVSLSVGQTQTLVPTVSRPVGSPSPTVAYSSSNPSVATVSSAGVVTAITSGGATVTVTASAPASSGFAAATVTATATITVISSAGCGSASIAANGFFSASSSASGGCDYVFATATPRTLAFELSTSTFTPGLFVSNGSPTYIGRNSASPLTLELLTAGTTNILVRSQSGIGGSFTLRTTEVTNDVSGCTGNRYALRGASANRFLSSTDCLSGGYYRDEFWIYLASGESMTIDMSASFDTFLYLYNASNTLVAQDDDGGLGTNSSLAFTAPTTGFYIVWASSYGSGTTGSYSISFR